MPGRVLPACIPVIGAGLPSASNGVAHIGAVWPGARRVHGRPAAGLAPLLAVVDEHHRHRRSVGAAGRTPAGRSRGFRDGQGRGRPQVTVVTGAGTENSREPTRAVQATFVAARPLAPRPETRRGSARGPARRSAPRTGIAFRCRRSTGRTARGPERWPVRLGLAFPQRGQPGETSRFVPASAIAMRLLPDRLTTVPVSGRGPPKSWQQLQAGIRRSRVKLFRGSGAAAAHARTRMAEKSRATLHQRRPPLRFWWFWFLWVVARHRF